MCDCNSSCGCEDNPKDCECCPVGYVGIYDEDGRFAGCVSPQEAEDYNNGKIQCADGYVKVIDPVTGDFIGCVIPTDVPALMAAITPALVLNITVTHVKCKGDTGSVAVQIIGGTAPYVIAYSGGAAPAALLAGNYTVTVTDNAGLSSAYDFVVLEPAAVLALATATTPDSGATDGTATATVTGGTYPYTYVWNDNLGNPIGQTTKTAIGLAAGTYQVFATDINGCVVNDVAVVVA